MMLLVPRDLLRPRRADDHFVEEAAAARDLGVEVALVDHDDLCREGGSTVAVSAVPPSDDAVYRGWMLPAARYRELEVALAARGTTLRTSADAFRRAHELPGWYDALAPWTPRSTWTDSDERTAFEGAAAALGPGPAVLRDHAKSEKHHWEEAAFVPDLADNETAWRVARRLRELRDDAFTGGFVLRRFERFTRAEVRTWWVDGRCALVGAHPDTSERLPDEAFAPPDGLADAVRALGLPFVTIDLVRHDDGRWRVVELGDGQVSDRPRTLPAAELVAALAR